MDKLTRDKLTNIEICALNIAGVIWKKGNVEKVAAALKEIDPEIAEGIGVLFTLVLQKVDRVGLPEVPAGVVN